MKLNSVCVHVYGQVFINFVKKQVEIVRDEEEPIQQVRRPWLLGRSRARCQPIFDDSAGTEDVQPLLGSNRISDGLELSDDDDDLMLQFDQSDGVSAYFKKFLFLSKFFQSVHVCVCTCVHTRWGGGHWCKCWWTFMCIHLLGLVLGKCWAVYWWSSLRLWTALWAGCRDACHWNIGIVKSVNCRLLVYC